MNTRWSVTALIALSLAAGSHPGRAQGVTAPASFQIRTVSDLAALCSGQAGGPNAEAGVYLCHGFLTGVGQYHAATRRPNTPYPPLFCPPSPPPSLNQAAAGFTAWARNNPQFADEQVVDGLVRWAQLTYPCPAPRPPRQ